MYFLHPCLLHRHLMQHHHPTWSGVNSSELCSLCDNYTGSPLIFGCLTPNSRDGERRADSPSRLLSSSSSSSSPPAAVLKALIFLSVYLAYNLRPRGRDYYVYRALWSSNTDGNSKSPGTILKGSDGEGQTTTDIGVNLAPKLPFSSRFCGKYRDVVMLRKANRNHRTEK